MSFAENKGERALPQRGVASTSSLKFCAMTTATTMVTTPAIITPTTISAELHLHATLRLPDMLNVQCLRDYLGVT